MTDMPIYKRGECWYVRVPLGASKYSRRSLGKISQKAAIEAAESILASGGSDILFNDASMRWLREYVPSLRKNSRYLYKAGIASAAAHMEGIKVRSIGAKHLAEWEADMRARGLSQSTIRTYFAALSSMYSWLKANGVYSDNSPVSDYKHSTSKRPRELRIAASAPRNRWLTEEEEAVVLRRIPSLVVGQHEQRMTHAAIVLAIDTGMRRGELLRFRRSWIKGGRIHIPGGLNTKTGAARQVPILRRAGEILADLPVSPDTDVVLWRPLVRQPAAGYYEDTMGYRLHAICADAKLPPVIWHDLRRTCGCRLLQGSTTTGGAKMRIESVSKWLGHADIRVTQSHYAFLNIDTLETELAGSLVEQTVDPQGTGE